MKKINQIKHRYIRYDQFYGMNCIPYFIEAFYIIRPYPDGPAKYIELWDYGIK